MAFGAKIRLSVDTSQKSHFRKEIQDYVNKATVKNPIKLKHFSVSINKEQQKKLMRELQTYLSEDDTLVIKIGKIDAKSAVNKLRQQLQTMLSGLSITGLKEFLGETNIDKITQDIDKAKQSASQWAAQMRVVEDIQKRLASTYKSALSGNKMIGDQTKIQEITNEYTVWQSKVEALRSTQKALSDEELQKLQQEGIAILQNISLTQEKQATATKVANAEKQEAKQREIDARKELTLAQQQVSLKSQIQNYINSNSKAYKVYGSELDGLLHRLTAESKLTDEELKEIRHTFIGIKTDVKAAGLSGNTFFDTMKKGFAKFGGWSLITRALMAAYRIFNKMITAVKELDAAMTELKKVTDLTERSYREYLNTAKQLSQSIGATLADTVNATADFARLGYSISESTSLAEAALVYKNVGDGIEDISTASESLISTIKAFEQFGESASNAMSIVDRFNEVGNNFAISSEGIGAALERSASSLAAAGNSLNESIALVTGMNAVVQDPEKVGTVLKTTSMFLRAAKTEAEEAGEETEGMANSVSELRQELLTLTKSKVDIMIDDKTFKSTYAIMKDLSEVWGDLADIDRANILELIGGKRNANAVTSLLTNFEDAEKALQTAAQSSGSALAENEKYLDSISGKISVFQSKFESFSTDLIDSSYVKTIVDLGSALLTVLDVLQKIHLLLPLISVATVAIFTRMDAKRIKPVVDQIIRQKDALLEEKIASHQLEVSINALNAQQQKHLVILLQKKVASGEIKEENYKQLISILKLSAAEKGLVAENGALIASNKSVAGSFKTIFSSISIGGWISLAISAVFIIIDVVNALTSSANELRDATIDTAKESTEHIKELESALKSYLELDTTATESEKSNALKAVTEQLENKTNALKNATSAERGYIDFVKESIQVDYQEAAGKAKDAAVAAKEKIASQWGDDYTRVSSAIGSESAYEEVKNILGDYVEVGRDPHGVNVYRIGRTIDGLKREVSIIDTSNTEALLKYYEKLQQAQTAIQQKAIELGEDGDSLLSSPLYKAISEILTKETNRTNVEDYINNRSEEIYDTAISNQGIPETVADFQKLKDTMLKQAGDSTLLADAITNRLNDAFSSLAEQAVKASNAVSNLDFTIDAEKLKKQLETQQEEISKIADSYQKICGIIDDYNENGNISIANLETLMSVGDDYVSTLFDENGQLNVNKDSYAKLAKSKLENIRYSMLENAISSLNRLSKDDEATSNDELAKSTGELTEETLRLVAAKKLAEGVDSTKIQNIINTYSQWSALIDDAEKGIKNNIDATLGLESASEKLKKSLESEKKALEKSKTALEDQKKALEDTKDDYENAIDSIKSLIDWTEKYIKQTKDDEIKSLEDKKKSIDDLVESQKELLEAQKDEYNWNKEISNKQNSVAKNALAASIASLDDSSAGKKAYKEAIDTLNESRSDMTDTLYEHSIDARIDTLDKMKDLSDEYYDGEIDKINEFLDDEVALYKAACSMIDNDNGTLYSNLLNYCRTYTTTSEAEFNHMWTSAQSAMQQYNIANLDTFSLLNNLQSRIYEVDNAIDTVASGIQSYEDKISGVQSKLDSLSDSAQTAISNINAAIEASSNLGNSEKTSFWVNYNGKKYQTGYNYNGDTKNNRLLAANELTKLIAKDVSGFDQYGLSIVQGLLGVGNEKTKSNNNPSNKLDSTALINGVKKDFKLSHYATGTKSAKGGLTNIDEEGLYSELIPYQVGDGRYTILPEGNPVFSKLMTNRLFDFASNPISYLQHIQPDLGSEIIPITTQTQISPSINITIQGDATQSTVNALRTEASKIINKATENVMNIALRNKRII